MEWLIHTILGLGVLAIALTVFAESGLLIGFFLPGDTLLFTAGFLVNQGALPVNIHLLVAILFIAAVAGDNVGYSFGSRVGRRLFQRKDSLLFKQENIARAEAFYEHYGGKTIILARFIPIVRTFAPIVAGIGKMRYRTFFAYNAIGGLLWTAGITYLGYFVGGWFTAHGLDIDTYLLPIIGLILVISVGPAVYHVLQQPEARAGLKRYVGRMFKK